MVSYDGTSAGHAGCLTLLCPILTVLYRRLYSTPPDSHYFVVNKLLKWFFKGSWTFYDCFFFSHSIWCRSFRFVCCPLTFSLITVFNFLCWLLFSSNLNFSIAVFYDLSQFGAVIIYRVYFLFYWWLFSDWGRNLVWKCLQTYFFSSYDDLMNSTFSNFCSIRRFTQVPKVYPTIESMVIDLIRVLL